MTQPRAEVEATIIDMAIKAREAAMMGRPVDAIQYTEALGHATAAWWNLVGEASE